MKQNGNYGGHRQQGIALPIIMIILVLAALVTVYTSTTSVKEQQVTADQYRSEQAFSSAQAGVDDGMKRHNDYPQFDAGGNPVSLEPDVISNAGFTMGSYRVMFCDIYDHNDLGDLSLPDGDLAPDTDDDKDGHTSVSLMADFLADTVECSNPINPADSNNTDADGFKNDARVGILSVGKPDDNSGRRTISVVSAPPNLLNSGGFDFLPLSARGSIAAGANITVINRYRNITVWSGLDLDVNSAAVSSYIHDGANDNLSRAELTFLPASTPAGGDIIDAIQASNDGIGKNSDILDNDFNLANMTEDEMFKGVFSVDQDTIKLFAYAAKQFYTDIDDIPDKATGLIWLKSPVPVSLKGVIGTTETPAFLIVEWDVGVLSADKLLTLTAGAEFHGLIFVFGDVQFTGGPAVYGSLIATGSLHKAVGGGSIVYDPEGLVVDPEGLSGLRGIVPGTWKDWGYVN